MLLPLFEEMRVFLAPDRVGLVRLRRGLRSKTLDAVTADATGNALGVMANRLKGRHLGVRTYLSSHYTRLLLLPWQQELEKENEWHAYAQHAFNAAFGSSPGRRIRLAKQCYGQPVIAAAIEETLHAGIDAAIAAAGAAAKSVEPYCTAAFDRHRGALPRDCWFFTAEPGMATGMRMEGGVLKSVSMHPLETDMRGSLVATIARELAKHQTGEAPFPVFLHAVTPISLNAGDLPGVAVKSLAAGRDEALGIVA